MTTTTTTTGNCLKSSPLREEAEICELLSLRSNKKLVKNIKVNDTIMIPSSKDLNSLKLGHTFDNNILERNVLQDCVGYLKTVDKATVEIIVDGDNLEGIYFQTERMKRAFSLNPELVVCDATCKLNNVKISLYILLVINGNDVGEVACTFILSAETISNMSEILKKFKMHSKNWENVQTVMTDKDFRGRAAFATELPSAKLALCLFHSLKSFRRNISKMDISLEEKDECLKLMEKIAYSSSECEYFNNYRILRSSNYKKFFDYFNVNWHGIRDQRVTGLLVKSAKTFNVTTTNHLEPLNKIIKQVVVKNSSLLQFYKDFVELLDSVYEARKLKLCQILSSRNSKVSDEYDGIYKKMLTPFAFDIVKSSLHKAKELSEFKEEYLISLENCLCLSFLKMSLPCKHMFSKRIMEGLPLFTDSELPQRFLLITYKNFYEVDLEAD